MKTVVYLQIIVATKHVKISKNDKHMYIIVWFSMCYVAVITCR